MIIIKSGLEIVKHRLNFRHYLVSKESTFGTCFKKFVVQLHRLFHLSFFVLFFFCAQIKFFKFMNSLFTKVAQCSNYTHL